MMEHALKTPYPKAYVVALRTNKIYIMLTQCFRRRRTIYLVMLPNCRTSAANIDKIKIDSKNKERTENVNIYFLIGDLQWQSKTSGNLLERGTIASALHCFCLHAGGTRKECERFVEIGALNPSYELGQFRSL